MTAIALLCVAGVAHLAPDLLAQWLGGAVGPWETVCYGAESALLWAALASRMVGDRAASAVCLYGLFESAQRAVCRQMLPMDKPAGLKPGQYLCDAATGMPVSMLSAVAVGLVLAVFVADLTKPTKVCSSNQRNDGAP